MRLSSFITRFFREQPPSVAFQQQLAAAKDVVDVCLVLFFPIACYRHNTQKKNLDNSDSRDGKQTTHLLKDNLPILSKSKRDLQN